MQSQTDLDETFFRSSLSWRMNDCPSQHWRLYWYGNSYYICSHKQLIPLTRRYCATGIVTKRINEMKIRNSGKKSRWFMERIALPSQQIRAEGASRRVRICCCCMLQWAYMLLFIISAMAHFVWMCSFVVEIASGIVSNKQRSTSCRKIPPVIFTNFDPCICIWLPHDESEKNTMKIFVDIKALAQI